MSRPLRSPGRLNAACAALFALLSACSDGSTDGDGSPQGPAITKASAVAVSGRNVRVSWEVPASVTSVTIERQDAANGSWVEVTRRADRTRFLDLGLQPQTAYRYRLRACDGAQCGAPYALDPVTTRASALPAVEITVADADRYTDDVVVLGVASLDSSYLSTGHIMALDRKGRILWEYENHQEGLVSEVEVLPEGRLAAEQTVQLVDLDLDGSVVKKFTERLAHHDIDPLPDGRFATLTFDRMQQGTSKVWVGDGIAILDADWGSVQWEWLARDHLPLTDLCPVCIQDDPYNIGLDWTHGNALTYDAEDQAFYVAMRNLDRIYKVAYPTGEIVWTMGKGGDFGEGLWAHCHDPQFVAKNRVLMLDNGLHRAGGEEYSRVIEIAFDPLAKTAEIVWEYRETPDFYSFALGSVKRYDAGNTFLADGVAGRLLEIAPDASVVWSAQLATGFGTYKAITVPTVFFTQW